MIRFVGVCLLGVSLVACQDKFQEVDSTLPKPAPEEGISLEEDYIPLFEADMEISENEYRAFHMTLQTQPNNTGDHAKLYSPRLKFKVGAQEEVDILLRKSTGTGVKFFRERGKAEFIAVSNNDRNAKVRIWIQKKNPKKNKSPFTFEQGETWHAMIIIGAEAGATQAEGENTPVAIFGERPADKSWLSSPARRDMKKAIASFIGNNQTAGSGAIGAYRLTGHGDNQDLGYYEIPLVSNWKQLVIIQNAKPSHDPKIPNDPQTLFRLAKGTGFSIKPQGVLLNYQVSVNVYEGIDMRRAGVVSNTLDFQGMYLLDEDNIKKAFEAQSQATDGFGIPAWQGTKSALNRVLGLKMYKASAEDYALGFPWDMPTISDIFAQTQGFGALPMTQTMSEADVSISHFYGFSPGGEYPDHVTGIRLGFTTPRIKSNPDNPPGNYPDVASCVHWAMPKETPPAKPFTYFWINAHSMHNAEEYYAYRGGLGANDEKYLGFLEQDSYRGQPMVVVHQTNANFKDQVGKTPRLYATLSTDLMITELTYKKVRNENFSVVELQNPSRLPLDLKNYALVRLVSDGYKMLYMKGVGQLTDKLEDAQLYYLSSLQKGDMIPGYGAKDGMSIADPARPTQEEHNKSFTGSYQRPFNQFEYESKRRLEPGQTVLLGASGYASKGNAITLQSWWSSFFPSAQQQRWYDGEKRLRYFAFCRGTSVLDINSNGVVNGAADGLALVKIIDGKRKVIDATAPVGRNNLYFSGDFESYKNKLGSAVIRGDYYTQKRKDGVVFPYMAPYRTTRKLPVSEWCDDWELLQTPNSHKLGHRWLASIDGSGVGENRYMILSRGSYFVEKRTSLGNPEKYKNSRPEHR
ncbi:MAG: hypothetical protein Q4A64_06530 [Porphyromonadaceae bacterium]|nr:hypothetical protein [Porphyromonadaceae bacterium]